MILIDTSNLYHSIKNKFGGTKRFNFEAFVNKYQGEKIAYVVLRDENMQRFIEYLQHLGINVKIKTPNKRTVTCSSCSHETEITFINWNATIIQDALTTQDNEVRICSNDPGLIPLVSAMRGKKLIFHGVNVSKTFKHSGAEANEILKDEVTDATE